MQQAIVNAYVLWAISEADVSAGKAQRTQRELAAELNRLKKEALQSSDPYLLALSAATLMNTGDRETGVRLLQQLSGLQGEDGSLNGETTVTSSGGISKQVETTALSILAWSKSAEYNTQARKAAKWLTANRQGNGGFGSTQATVLALKAMIAIANNSSRTGDKLRIKIGDTTVSEIDLPSDPRGGDSILVSGLGDHFDIGDAGGEDPTIQLSVDSPLSYTIDVGYHDLAPKNNDSCPLRISTELVDASRKGKVTAGQVTKVRSVIENTSERGLPMTVASIGLPGGLEPTWPNLISCEKKVWLTTTKSGADKSSFTGGPSLLANPNRSTLRRPLQSLARIPAPRHKRTCTIPPNKNSGANH